MKIKKIIAGLLVATTAFSLAACGNSGSGDTKKSDAYTSEKKEIVYGKSQGPYTELFEDAIVPILEEKGYTVKGVDLSDLQTADIALNDGEVDVNVEQHTAYMDNFNKSYDGDLVAISPIPTVPAGVYSDKYDSLDDIKDGAKVAVPNDASNTARCYLMLQKIGWIKIDENADPSTVTQEDIVENPYNIQFTEMNSMTIPATMADFDYVAITGSVVYNAGIDASTALANEDIQDYLVLQVVVKEENKDADWAKAIVDAYHSDEFKKYMEENNDGLWWIPEELQ
jgi:D-methionine transport system substrate-binding protein